MRCLHAHRAVPTKSEACTYRWPPCRARPTSGKVVPCRHGTATCRGVPPCRSCRAKPCYEPGVRPMTRHMGRLPVPCRPWAMVIFTVSCRPMARQHEHFNKITYKLIKYKANSRNPNFMKLTIIKKSCVQCCLIKNLSR
jgi:hypothetical protein